MIKDLRAIGFLLFLLFVLSLLFPANLFAHKVYVFAWVEDGNIISESKFSSNKFVKNGKIIIQNQKNITLLTGTTTDKGIFSFKIPDNIDSDLLIVLDAGMGHRAEWRLKLDEILKAGKGKSSTLTSENNIQNKIETPSIVDIVAGILIIFIFFIFMAYYNKKKLSKK